MDKGDFLGDRRKSLEDAFFHAEEEKNIQKMRAELDKKSGRDELRSVSGISDEAVLDQLVAMGVNGRTVAALSLIPLLRVAWADGKMDEKERDAVLAAAQGKGIEVGSASFNLLHGWLDRPPSDGLFDSWKAYIRELMSTLVPPQRALLKNQIVGFARGVAEAAGGFMGLKTVSAAEEKALADIQAAFDEPAS